MATIAVKGRKPRVSSADGHGLDTNGKETPPLPQLNGKRMKEKEFNQAVQNYFAKELARCDIDHKDVAVGDKDVPLATRAKISNDFNADLHIDIHANAFDGILNDKAGGIETFYFESSTSKSKACASIIHKHTMMGTKMKDRGIKKGNHLYMLNTPKATAVLTELGFMDNKSDVAHLLSDAYRKECAVELAKAVCEIFGIAYKEEVAPKPTPAPSKPDTATDDGTFYRVVTGSFKHRESAEAQMKEIKEKTGLDSFLLPYKP